MCDSRLGHEKRARDLVRGEPADQAQRERKWANAGTFNLLRLVALSTGWHDVKIRRRRSSPMSLYFRSRSERRRTRSIARCFAAAMSHAPGFGRDALGRGHLSSSAATSAAMREIFGDADVVRDARQTCDQARRLDASDGVQSRGACRRSGLVEDLLSE